MIPQKPNITFDEFEKLDVRMCKILSVERVENTDKLYKMQIDTGIDQRIVVSSIAQQISIPTLEGQFLPFVLNLEPRKIRGIESNAMIILGKTNSNELFRLVHTKDIEEEKLIGAQII
jgi:methionyl-tRNA synthetase